jgi:hypothetical protein
MWPNQQMLICLVLKYVSANAIDITFASYYWCFLFRRLQQSKELVVRGVRGV